jgi:AcrR family transcriptional regulator
METRQRILAIAGELFAAQGYAGTSIADITGRLGTTKAALYYHFASKSDILVALVEEPLTAFAKLAESTAAPADLLAAVIDTTATYLGTTDSLGSDPSVRQVLRDRARERGADEINAAIIAALAGQRPSAMRRVRAHAAYAVAKHATLSLAENGAVDPRDRAEILAVALRVLDTGQ